MGLWCWEVQWEVLLLGPAGVSRTSFAQRLAKDHNIPCVSAGAVVKEYLTAKGDQQVRGAPCSCRRAIRTANLLRAEAQKSPSHRKSTALGSSEESFSPRIYCARKLRRWRAKILIR